ncbi:putative holin-like toxin [Anaerocolumna jejuensis]|nr:putative holin-like toxin [Anaerocolumna jejuensis]
MVTYDSLFLMIQFGMLLIAVFGLMQNKSNRKKH